ncbi:MAG: hypothetical protein V3573_14395 [Desulfovibrionaceae bacterium]
MAKIYTRIVMDWDLEVLESESFLYEGPVGLCMAKTGGADSEAGGDAGRGEGRNGGGSGNSGGSERGGGGGNFGGISYGGAHSGGLGLGGISSAVAETVGRESFGGLAGSSRGSEGSGSSERSSSPSFGSADAKYSRTVHASAPDMSDQISGLTGKQVTRTDVGYVDDTGTRMAYSSGEPTSFGAHATARENDMGQSWAGAQAMSSMAGDARHDARRARAREIQARVTAALKDPLSLGLDPHQAFAAYNDAMHGMYDKAVAVGAMTPEEAADVQTAYGSPMDAIGKAFGYTPEDVTTPYEKSVTAIAAGLVDPTTGKLTAKGWANVAAPALGMLAGPLAGLGMSVAGIPGAIVGALAPTVANAYASSGVPTSKASTVAGEAASAFGLNAGPVAAGVAYGAVMDTMSGAQSYMGTQPTSVSGIESHRGEGASEFESMFSGFFTKKSSNKRSAESEEGINPAFKAAREGKPSSTSTAKTTSPVVPDAVTAVNFDSIFSGFFTRG